MGQHYTLNTFLRQTPKNLLAEYFRHLGLLGDIDFESLKKTEYESIIREMENLPDDSRAGVENDFQDIFTLANPSGTQIMLDMAGYLGIDIANILEAKENHYDRAMWLFLEHNNNEQDLFRVCARHAHIKNLPFSKTKNRKDLPKQEPRHDQATLDHMATALQDFYRGQGRGHECIVEHTIRPNPTRHCYYAFPEDYSTSELQYVESNLVAQNRKSVMEVGFIFWPDEGTLEIGAHGKKQEIQALQHIFCQHALGMEELPPIRNDQVFRLNELKRRYFDFPTDPEDRIESVEVVALRFNLTGNKDRKVLIEQSSDSLGSLHDWIARALNQVKVPLAMWEVTQAKIKVTWRLEPGKRQKTLTFTLTTPDSSTLKDMPHHLVIKEYLKRWNLM